jgi:tRNA(Ile)-lysidine synthase
MVRAELHSALGPWLDQLPMLADLARADAPVVVGCSGGGDSLALLALAAAGGVRVVAVHVDHGLRPGSDAEFPVVADAAAAFGVPARSVTIELEPGANLEARAREARYRALEQARVGAGAAAVAVGHTADDQGETVLLNLLRGSATAGLAAMAPRQGTVARPLLGLRRRDTVEICARLRLAPVVDPMNGETRFRRVWLRREVLPALEAGAHRDLRGLLARQAEVLRDESDLLETIARDALAEAGAPPRVRAIAALEPAVARRALRQWLGGAPPSLAAIDALLAVVAGERRAVELPGGRRVVRRDGCLVLEGTGAESRVPAHPQAPVEFSVPGTVAAEGIELDAWVERAAPVSWPDGRETCVVDADAVGDHAWLRAAARGERFAPLGLSGTKPVTGSAVVASGASSGVIWVVGYRIDDRVRVTSRTRRFLWMSVSARAPAQ